MAECAAHILAAVEQGTDVVLHNDTYARSGDGDTLYKSRMALKVAHLATWMDNPCFRDAVPQRLEVLADITVLTDERLSQVGTVAPGHLNCADQQAPSKRLAWWVPRRQVT